MSALCLTVLYTSMGCHEANPYGMRLNNATFNFYAAVCWSLDGALSGRTAEVSGPLVPLR